MAITQQSTEPNKTVEYLCERIKALLGRQSSSPDRRILIACAGVPGSGKSTTSSALLKTLPIHGINSVVLVPMDGFHYSKSVLSSMSDPAWAFRKRGAPFTFDVKGFIDLVMTLKSTPVTESDDPKLAIKVPSFDHAMQDPVADDIQVSSATKVVIIEGNYTLLDEDPWNKLAKIVDEKWFVDVHPEAARERLIARHIAAGIETSREAAAGRAEDNDIPNGDLIRSKLIEPDVRILN